MTFKNTGFGGTISSSYERINNKIERVPYISPLDIRNYEIIEDSEYVGSLRCIRTLVIDMPIWSVFRLMQKHQELVKKLNDYND